VLLDPRARDEATARLAAAVAHRKLTDTAIVRAIANRDQAVLEADRGRKLVAHAAIPIAERDRLELAERVAIADVAAAELDRNAAQANVDAARAALGEGKHGPLAAFPIVAPIAGRVLKLVRDSAGPVAAGAPLLELGDPRALEVVVDVLSADAAKITPGMRVELGGWGGDRPLAGHVRLVEPAGFTKISALGVEEQRVNVIVALDDGAPALGDGFRVDARIILWHGDALIVPASAVFRDHDRWAVYAVIAGVARLVPVELGHRGRTDVEIAAGLSIGDIVVLHPTDRVIDGAKLAVR
jgi:HlyD family secretion protein